MEFDQDLIDSLDPITRVEIQEYYLLRFNYSKKKREPERRKPPKKWLPRNPRPWPTARETWGNEMEYRLRKLEHPGNKKPMTTFVRRKRSG